MVNKFNKDVRNKTNKQKKPQLFCIRTGPLGYSLSSCIPGQSSMSDPPGSSVHGILQARTLEWVAIPFSRGSPPPRDRTRVSCVAGRVFTVWASRDTHNLPWMLCKLGPVWGAKVGRLFTVVHCLQVSPRCQSGSLPSTLPSSAGFSSHPPCAF